MKSTNWRSKAPRRLTALCWFVANRDSENPNWPTPPPHYLAANSSLLPSQRPPNPKTSSGRSMPSKDSPSPKSRPILSGAPTKAITKAILAKAPKPNYARRSISKSSSTPVRCGGPSTGIRPTMPTAMGWPLPRPGSRPKRIPGLPTKDS